MSEVVNAEVVNDFAKLAMHRLLARALARNPKVLDDAKQALRRQARQYPGRTYWQEWDAILNLPIPEICSKITSHDEDMVRLRTSSPLVFSRREIDLTVVPLRRRIWKLASRHYAAH